MTSTKPKYNFWNWLIHTQFIEIVKAKTKRQRADEEADMINVILQDMEESGFDPVEVFSQRLSDKQDEVRAIAAKYREKWREIVDKVETSIAP